MNLYIYEETTSTNDLGRASVFRHSDVIWAYSQSAGRGQRGNRWIGGVGENITFTVVLEPTFLEANNQFLISQITALALHSAMCRYGIESRIKWTNDIYVADRKLAGILIENSLSGTTLARSIIGIGLNVNQKEFDPSIPNPTSMMLECGRRFSNEEALRTIHSELMRWYAELESGGVEAIRERYRALLYRLNEAHTYRVGGVDVEACIEGVEEQGALILRWANGERSSYQFREVEFVIAGRDK